VPQRVAIYCRLSKEDAENMGEPHTESESIQNQKALLVKYAEDNGWEVVREFCDEDYSGIDRERPGFNRLIEEAEKGKFDIILVKTQSRFTRDMEMVEKYIHHQFLVWGIRFVALLDHVDTAVKGNKKARQINGLINEWYLEDLSENIRAVFDYKRRNGQYIGSFPIFGYQKSHDNKNQLVIDPSAAEVIKKIFQLYLEGNGKQHIAFLLNQEGIPNPTKYKQQQGWNYVNGAQTNEWGLWNRTSVGRILHNRMYTGDLVQGKRKKVSYKSKLLVPVAEDEWMIVPDAHEPIIDKVTFSTVNRLLEEHTKTSGTGEVHLLAGKVKCMDCGGAMLKVSNSYQGGKRSYLRCKLFATDKNRCTSHAIRLDSLETEITQLLRDYIQRYYDPSSAEALISAEEAAGKKTWLNKEIKTLQADIDRRTKAMRDLYLDKSSGLIGESQFMELNSGYLAEKTATEKRVSQLMGEKTEWENQLCDKDVLREKINRWLNLEPLPRELVAEFIDTIEIGERHSETGEQPIRIHWLF
jgi:DNA invertase Pin-like site-specific DNA recombinase